MLENPHQYALEMFKDDHTPLGQVAVEVDWEPARESVCFSAARRGELPIWEAGRTASVEPVWHRTLGEPYLSGFRVAVSRNGSGEVGADFPLAYFSGLAQTASSYFVKRGQLKDGEYFKYSVLAFPRRDEPGAQTGLRLVAEEVAPTLALAETALASFLAQAAPAGTIEAGDMPAFIPRQVHEEAAALTRAAAENETGGILIGHLHRDSGIPDIFAEVTAQVPAEHTRGTSTRLTFTPETWTAVDAAIKLRRRHEVYLGFWHSHPVQEWCKDCPPEKQRGCNLAKGFFSADDQALFRTCFSRAYNLALVSSVIATGEVKHSLFGWRRGLIEPRGYYIIGGAHVA